VISSIEQQKKRKFGLQDVIAMLKTKTLDKRIYKMTTLKTDSI